MNACKIFLLIISIMSEDIRNITCTNTLEMGLAIYHKNTKAIHNTMNKIFSFLKLKKTFKESTKIRLLIAMHKNLMNILRNIYKNSEGENNSDNTPITTFPKNNKIDEILEEEYTLLFLSLNGTVQNDVPNGTLNDSVSDQFSGHLKQFLLHIDTTNHDTNNNNGTKSYNKTLTRRSGRESLQLNLKAWVPDAVQSFAFNRRIYKSKYTRIKKYPFMASVHISGEFVCAGSIVSKDLVITAASCLQEAYLHRHTKDYQNNISVRIGSDYSTNEGEYIPISFIYFYPKYNPTNLKHNLAIMRMSKNKHFSEKNKIRRVLFDKTSHALPSDVQQVTIVGWGAKDQTNRKESDILSLAHLNLYDIEECKAVYSDLYVTEANFCAGFISKGSGACNKDVGDPAVLAGVLVGVVSFGPPHCGTPDAPTVFTRLGLYADWIDSILKMDPSSRSESKPYLRMTATTARKPQYDSKLKREGVNGLGLIRLELPEEFFILKEILTDIAKSNDSDIKEVIDEGFDKEFLDFIKPTPQMILKNHPLVNKSRFGISGANFPQEEKMPEIKTKKLTTTNVGFDLPENGFPDFGGDYQQLGELADVLYEQQVSNLPLMSKYPLPVLTKTTKHLNKRVQRKGSTLNNPVKTTPMFDDDYYFSDASSGNYEGTGSDEGLSIEVKKSSMKPIDTRITKKVLFDSDDNDFDYSNVKSTTKATTKSEPSEDYKNIFFVLENEVEVNKYDEPHSKSIKPTSRDKNNNKNTFTRTTIASDDDDYTPGSEDSRDSENYIAIANKNFRYDSVANRFTRA